VSVAIFEAATIENYLESNSTGNGKKWQNCHPLSKRGGNVELKQKEQ
jgi:hypothetical protein